MMRVRFNPPSTHWQKLDTMGNSLFIAAEVAQIIPVLLAHPELIPAVIAALGANAPESPVPSGWTYSIDGDGKVTVMAPA